jgi:rhomboid protease GluP
MICLLALGAYVEHDLGHISYLIMYFLSGIIGNVVSIGWDMLLDEYSVSVGASGAVFGVTGAAVVILFFGRKRLKLKGSTIIPRMAAVVALDLYSGYADNTINGAAHFGGLIGGIIITVLITLIGRKQYTMEEWV